MAITTRRPLVKASSPSSSRLTHGPSVRLGRLLAAALAWALGVWVAAPALASPQGVPPVGRVVFVAGSVQALTPQGGARALADGEAIHAGEQVVTGPDAYIHLRMIDQAFVAVRPQSRLTVELYEYNPSQPSASRIRLSLDRGNTRTVSGKGGEAARQNYRFNTPMAAIGLRGTDYTVTALDTATRVSVARGAVAVTPLGNGCSADGLGPCVGSSTRELAAGMAHAYLEVNALSRTPLLVRPGQEPPSTTPQSSPGATPTPAGGAAGSPVQASPAGATGNTTTAPASSVQPSSTASRPAVDPSLTAVVVAEKVVTTVTQQARPPEVVPPRPPELYWGRWSTYAKGEGSPAMVSLLGPASEIVVGNTVFGLLRSTATDATLPAQGAFSFKLAQSEAYTVSGSTLTPAQVLKGDLSIDFQQRSFATSLDVRHSAGTEQLYAAGVVQFQGLLWADAARSNMKLDGAVVGKGTEAAYVFEKSLAGGGLLGAVRWLR